MDEHRQQHRHGGGQYHGRQQMADVPPEAGNVQADVFIVVAVHQEHVAHQRGDRRADGRAQPLPFHTQGDGDHDVAHQYAQIDQRTVFVHILGTLYLDTHGLYVGPQAGEEQQQRGPIVDAELLAAAPQHHEGLADGHEAQEYAAQQDKLQPPHLGKQGVQRPHGGVLRHQTVDAGRHHVGDGVAEQQEIVVQLRGDDVDRHRGRAVEPRQQLPVDGPVDVVHHNADEHIQRKAEHLTQQREVVVPEGEGHFQPRQAVGDIDHAAEHREDQRDDGQRHGPVAYQQQGDHNEGVQHLLAHGYDLLEQIPLVDGHMALEHADGERQRSIDRHDTQQPLGKVDLLRCQLLAEHHIAVGQPEADGQHQRTQNEVRYQEHTVQLGAALLVAGGTEAGVIPHIGAAQAEAQ